jgi:hypothetical protein
MPAGARGSAGEVPWTEVLVEDGNLLAAHDKGAAGKTSTSEAALPVVRSSLALRTQVQGAEHPDTDIYEHEQPGQRLCCAGRLQAGCALHVEVLGLRKRGLGADHQDIAI